MAKKAIKKQINIPRDKVATKSNPVKVKSGVKRTLRNSVMVDEVVQQLLPKQRRVTRCKAADKNSAKISKEAPTKISSENEVSDQSVNNNATIIGSGIETRSTSFEPRIQPIVGSTRSLINSIKNSRKTKGAMASKQTNKNSHKPSQSMDSSSKMTRNRDAKASTTAKGFLATRRELLQSYPYPAMLPQAQSQAGEPAQGGHEETWQGDNVYLDVDSDEENCFPSDEDEGEDAATDQDTSSSDDSSDDEELATELEGQQPITSEQDVSHHKDSGMAIPPDVMSEEMEMEILRQNPLVQKLLMKQIEGQNNAAVGRINTAKTFVTKPVKRKHGSKSGSSSPSTSRTKPKGNALDVLQEQTVRNLSLHEQTDQ